MKTLMNLIVLSIIISTNLFAQKETAEQMALATKAQVSEALETLEELSDEERISFKDAFSESSFLKTLRKLDKAISALDTLAETVTLKNEIDVFVKEARFVQKILSGFLGAKEFHGYKLREDSISIVINSDIIIEEVLGRLDFIDIGVGGRVSVRTGGDAVSRFNRLKTEYYSLLVEAAAIDPSDTRVKALAKWGHDTDVIYPGETFGDAIIETRQMWDLNLKD